MCTHLHRGTERHIHTQHGHTHTLTAPFVVGTLTDLVSYSRFADTFVRHLSSLILALIVILIVVVVVALLQHFVSLTWRLIGFINVLGAFTGLTCVFVLFHFALYFVLI